MPYRLEPNEPVAAGLKRVVAEEFAWAVDHLSGKQKTGRDAAIHETRKSIKKIRAVLRLVSCQIGDPWRAENNRLRKVAHTLAEFRDAAVMIHTFDELKREFRDDGWPRTLSSVRSAFRQKADSETRREITRILKATIPVLRKTAADAQAWPLGGDGFAVLEPGLEKAYRRSRKALARARNSAF